jgi:nucleoside-diphosphate-sugar epimerase
MKSIIITGATGMIGRTFVDLLLKKNIKILMIIRKESHRKNLIPIHPNIKTIECNLDELENLTSSKEIYDVFLHLAWDRYFW